MCLLPSVYLFSYCFFLVFFFFSFLQGFYLVSIFLKQNKEQLSLEKCASGTNWTTAPLVLTCFIWLVYNSDSFNLHGLTCATKLDPKVKHVAFAERNIGRKTLLKFLRPTRCQTSFYCLAFHYIIVVFRKRLGSTSSLFYDCSQAIPTKIQGLQARLCRIRGNI